MKARAKAKGLWAIKRGPFLAMTYGVAFHKSVVWARVREQDRKKYRPVRVTVREMRDE